MLAGDLCARAQQLIADRTGMDVSGARATNLGRMVVEAAGAAGAAGPASYLAALEGLPASAPAWSPLIARVSVSETYFFRDDTFDVLESDVLPALIERRQREGTPHLRLWSAGCATGEEAYSLAMLVDRLLSGYPRWSLSILGTDLDADALEVARRGVYRDWSLRTTPAWARARYLTDRGDGTVELDRRIRAMVTFAQLNLAGPPPAGGDPMAMDLVLCRNVVMYLTPEARDQAVARLIGAMAPDGVLGLSAVEASATLLHPLVPVTASRGLLHARSATPSRAPEPRLASEPPPVHQLPPAADPPRTRPRRPVKRAVRRDRDTLLRLAHDEAGRGNLTRARELCQDAMPDNRLDADAQLLLAAIDRERGDTPAARRAAHLATCVAPESPAAHFVLGGLLLADGDVQGGRASMRQVLELLEDHEPSAPVRGADGLAAGQMREIARSLLEAA